MLQNDPLREHIISRFDGMSPQLQQAARYILEHPQEVALVSMRELSRNAGVQPSTMTRLAKFLDLPGYDDIRSHHAEALRFRADGTPHGAARIGDHWQVKLSEAEKPAALRAALEAGARDITLEDPSLDDIYAHFLRREAA